MLCLKICMKFHICNTIEYFIPCIVNSINFNLIHFFFFYSQFFLHTRYLVLYNLCNVRQHNNLENCRNGHETWICDVFLLLWGLFFQIGNQQLEFVFLTIEVKNQNKLTVPRILERWVEYQEQYNI